MIIEKRLKKISDTVFQEAQKQDDMDRALEWRRHWTSTTLPLKNLKISNLSNVHETKIKFGTVGSDLPLKQITPDISDNIIIHGELDEERAKDIMYCAAEEDGGDDTYCIERPQGTTTVRLRNGSPNDEEDDRFAEGVYVGYVTRSNFEPGDDELFYELTLPAEQIESLIEAIRLNNYPKVEVGVEVLSFTFEVEDSLREPYHPRDILINEMTSCMASWVSVTSKYGKHVSEPNLDQGEGFFEPNISFLPDDLEDDSNTVQKVAHVATSFSKSLNRLNNRNLGVNYCHSNSIDFSLRRNSHGLISSIP